MSDRGEIKKLQEGVHLGIAGISNAKTSTAQLHEETFVFITFAAAPYVEQGIAMTKACRVKSIRLCSATTLATDATNNITSTVAKRDGAGGAAATIGAHTSNVAGGALTAFTPRTVTVDTDNDELAAGNVLTFKTADNGTTTEPLLSCAVTVEYI